MVNRTYTKRTWQLFMLWLVSTLVFGMLQFWIHVLIHKISPDSFEENAKETLLGLCFTASGIVVSTAFGIWTADNRRHLDTWTVMVHVFLPLILLLFGTATYVAATFKTAKIGEAEFVIMCLFFCSFIYGSLGTIELYSKDSDNNNLKTP